MSSLSDIRCGGCPRHEATPVDRTCAERLVIHFTPKQGYWLDLAEIELSVLGRQRLDRRISDRKCLCRQAGA